MCSTRVYQAYLNAKSRCAAKSGKAYRNYGSRGIRFLFTSFEQFFAELGECAEGITLGRINNDGHYAPGNVRWENRQQQSKNTRRNHLVTAFGRTETVATWARMFNMDSSLLCASLKKGRTPEQCLSDRGGYKHPTGLWIMVLVPADPIMGQDVTWRWEQVPNPALEIRFADLAEKFKKAESMCPKGTAQWIEGSIAKATVLCAIRSAYSNQHFGKWLSVNGINLGLNERAALIGLGRLGEARFREILTCSKSRSYKTLWRENRPPMACRALWRSAGSSCTASCGKANRSNSRNH